MMSSEVQELRDALEQQASTQRVAQPQQGVCFVSACPGCSLILLEHDDTIYVYIYIIIFVYVYTYIYIYV